MNRIRWNHIYCKFVILLLLILVTYLLVSSSKTHTISSEDLINKFTSNRWIQTLVNHYEFYCIECNNSRNRTSLNDFDELEFKKLSRFDAIPFNTVEDAWSPNNRLLAPYIRYDQNTTILYPNFQGRPIPTVLIAVASAPGNFLSRRLIRNTWGNRKSFVNSTDISITHEVVFVIGKPAIPFENQSISKELTENVHAVSDLIEEEYNQYQDILQEDFLDTYMNLTLKSMFILKYANSLLTSNLYKSTKSLDGSELANKQLEFILKSDDNCYVNIEALKLAVTRWRSQPSRKKSLTGFKIDLKQEKIPVKRPTGIGSIQDNEAKRFEVPIWMHQEKYFPPFLSGAGYFFPAEAIHCLYSQGIKTPLVHLEDVFITGIIGASKCGLKLEDDKRHFANMGYQLNCSPKSHNMETYIVIHNVNTRKDIELLHKIVLQNITMIDCENEPLANGNEHINWPKNSKKL